MQQQEMFNLEHSLVNLEICPKFKKVFLKNTTYLEFFQISRLKQLVNMVEHCSFCRLTEFFTGKCAKFFLIQTTLDTMCAKQCAQQDQARAAQLCAELMFCVQYTWADARALRLALRARTVEEF